MSSPAHNKKQKQARIRLQWVAARAQMGCHAPVPSHLGRSQKLELLCAVCRGGIRPNLELRFSPSEEAHSLGCPELVKLLLQKPTPSTSPVTLESGLTQVSSTCHRSFVGTSSTLQLGISSNAHDTCQNELESEPRYVCFGMHHRQKPEMLNVVRFSTCIE